MIRSTSYIWGAVLLLVAAISPIADAAAETLTVKVSGFKGSSGNLQVMIWKDAAGFPSKPEKAVAQKSVPVAGRSMEVVFEALPPGQYATAAYQDLNGNGKLDRSVLGWPVEPVGASNGATGMVGPPKFADAAFLLRGPRQTVELVLK